MPDSEVRDALDQFDRVLYRLLRYRGELDGTESVTADLADLCRALDRALARRAIRDQ